MPEKPDDVSGYTARGTELAERTLLEVWRHLGDFHEHLVLVGGLVPRYLVDRRSDANGADRPHHCGSLDVDLGLSLLVEQVDAYRGIRDTLVKRLGFEPGLNEAGRRQRHSFVRRHEGTSLIVDFLTVQYGGPDAVIRSVERDLSAIQVEGLGLALRDPRVVEVTGELLVGGVTTERIRICRPIPFVVLKALAFGNRGEPKDAYDLVYTLMNYGTGPSSVAGETRQTERDADAFVHACEVLGARYASPEHDGPAAYARFLRDEARAATATAFAAVQEFLAVAT